MLRAIIAAILAGGLSIGALYGASEYLGIGGAVVIAGDSPGTIADEETEETAGNGGPVFTSAYTEHDIETDETCSIAFDDTEYGAIGYRCESGLDGISVWISDFDARMAVSYGPDGGNEMAASQTLPPFNTVGNTIEWRLRDGEAFATILRWYTSVDDSEGGMYEGQVLVVTRLGQGNTCHVARIDALANDDANALAREAADTMAAGFDCDSDDIATIGTRGRSW